MNKNIFVALFLVAVGFGSNNHLMGAAKAEVGVNTDEPFTGKPLRDFLVANLVEKRLFSDTEKYVVRMDFVDFPIVDDNSLIKINFTVYANDNPKDHFSGQATIKCKSPLEYSFDVSLGRDVGVKGDSISLRVTRGGVNVSIARPDAGLWVKAFYNFVCGCANVNAKAFGAATPASVDVAVQTDESTDSAGPVSGLRA